MFLNISREHR